MFDKRIVPPMTQEVLATISQIQIPYTGKSKYETAIKEWLSPIIDLSGFYVYPADGITGAINYWLSREKRTVLRQVGDYEWVNSTGNEVLYMTSPSSIDGNYTTIPTDIPVVLDIAYVGSTAIRKIELPDNVEKVFYSLSKPFGMQNIRTGWYFTKRPDVMLHKLTYEAHYYNYFAHACAESIISKFDIDYAYKYYIERQLEICNEYNLTPSDSVWLATSEDEQYKDYIRKHLARLSLCSKL